MSAQGTAGRASERSPITDHRPCRRRALTLALVATVTILMATPGAVQSSMDLARAVAGSSGDAASLAPAPAAEPVSPTPQAPAAGLPSAPSAQIQAATASLEQGGGPANGLPLECSSAGQGSATCKGEASAGTSAATELAPDAAASDANPLGSDLAWAVQGVPQAEQYIEYAMTWDYYDNYLVLFGGSSEGPTINVYGSETWTYQSGVWTQLYPLVSPQGRDSSGMAYSPSDDAVVLFGGYSPGTGGFLNDTWLFKAGSWTQLDINGPSPRNGFGIVYDPALGADVLFGGESPQCPQDVCNDTWEFHDDSWTLVTGAGSPPQRWQQSMAYDANDTDVVMFGGLSVDGACASNICGDTWQFNASAEWSQVPTNVLCGTVAEGACPAGKAPSPRHLASMAYDYATQEIILFGGWNTSIDFLGDTWSYSNGNWSQLSPSASPTGRSGAALAFDFSAGDGYLLLVGGQPAEITPPALLYAWNGATWVVTQPSPSVSPGATVGGSMAYDPADGYVVFFGGYNDATGAKGQTWIYLHGAWSRLGGPAPSNDYYAAMAYDPAGGYLLLFGGANGLNETWAFHGGGWTLLCAETCAYGLYAPSDRYGAGLAYDPSDQAMILFGGNAYEGSTLGYVQVAQTWAWFVVSPTTGYWVNYTGYLGSSAPAARAFPGMTYDAYDGEIVLYGGGTYSAVYGDTWTLTSLEAGWKEVGTCGGPSQSTCSSGADPSAAMVFDYDSLLDGVVMSGGVGGNAFSGYLNYQTYFFQNGSWTECTSGYTCYADYEGWATYDGWGASAYDAADGYVVTSGGEGYWYNYALGTAAYYQIPYSWVLGQPLFSQGPGLSPEHVDVGESVTFDVGATGGGIGTYSYGWNGLPTGCAPSSATVTSFTCVIQNNGFGQYGTNLVAPYTYFDPSVELIDSSGWPSAASPDTANWLGHLDVAPDPWVTLTGSTTVADVGQTVYFNVSTTDGWGPYSDTWSGLPPGCGVDVTSNATEVVTCLLTTADIGDWSPQAQSVDATGYAALSRALQLTVFPASMTTEVASNVVSLDAGQTLSLWVTPSGGDGSYSYVWTGVPAACLSDAAVLSCAVPASEIGRYAPSVTITDGLGSAVVGSYPGSIVVAAAPTATALVITNASDDPIAASDAGLSVTFTLTSTPGSGGDQVLWTGLPAGCSPSTSNSTTVSCAPTGVGSFSVTATVVDSNGVGASSPAASLLVAPALSDAEVSASALTVDIGQELTVSVTYQGGGGTVAFAWSGLPDGCVASDAATWTCSPSAAGRYTPAAHLSDAGGGSATATLASAVVVSADPTATGLKVVTSADQAVGTVSPGTVVEFELTVTAGAGGDTIVWSGLPSGCLAPNSDAIDVSCQPNASGTYTVSATETDANGVAVTSPTASLVVASPASSSSSTSPLQDAELGMLAALIVIGVVAVVLALRRPGAPRPPPSGPSPSPPPAGATSGGGTPGWKET